MKTDNGTVSISIAGPPCSGKSTMGKLLAIKLGLPFFDLDTRIEEVASMSIHSIFSRFGEEEFRRLESEALDYILSTDGRIILALGGGCLLKKDNLIAVRKKGIIITLAASNDVLLKRRELQKDNRPLAMNDRAFIELLKSRNEHYNSLPNLIDTSDITPEETVLEIIKILGSGLIS
ncbi:MAG: shikimate kinase [Candidatus Aegiribacteria sp.]|nr:shikimate kinase [Candidatus Aegiribacteria sp.]